MLPFGCKNLRELVVKWNSMFPLDMWYRDRYKIAFNSEDHKKLSLIDMFFEYYEYYTYQYKPRKLKEIEAKKEKEQAENYFKDSEYIRGKGNFMKVYIPTKKDIDRMFEEFDIDNA